MTYKRGFRGEIFFLLFDDVSNLRGIRLNKRMRFKLLHPMQYPIPQYLNPRKCYLTLTIW